MINAEPNQILPQPSNWHSLPWRAMGTDITLWLETDDAAEASSAFNQAKELFHQHETIFSRFQDASELSQLNRRGGKWTAVTTLFWEVLLQALAMAKMTNGRFDPTMLNALEQLGYDRSFDLLGTVPFPTQVSYPRTTSSWHSIQLDPRKRRVYLPAGMRLDFGGIVKGYTAQKAVTLLEQWGPSLVDAGGDLQAGSPPTGYPGWPVAVSGPRHSEPVIDLFTIPLANAALASSGIDYRHWSIDGHEYHHLLDPRTKQPAATDLMTATVYAETAVYAEAWATAAVVYGAQAAVNLFQKRDIAAVLITKNQKLILTPAMAQLANLLGTGILAKS